MSRWERASESARRVGAGDKKPERATHCRTCGVALPSDRLAVAAEEDLDTARGAEMAARLRSDRCLKCSAPGPRGGNPNEGLANQPERQRYGRGKTS